MKIISKKDKWIVFFGDSVWQTLIKNPLRILNPLNCATLMLIFVTVGLALGLLAVGCIVGGIANELWPQHENFAGCLVLVVYPFLAIPFVWNFLGTPSAQRLCIEENRYLSYTYWGGFVSAIKGTPMSDISTYDFQRHKGRITLVLEGKIQLAVWTQSYYCIPIPESGVVQVICDNLRACGYGDRIRELHNVDKEAKESFLRDLAHLVKG